MRLHEKRTGTLTCVGLGPGGEADLTARARDALATAEVIVGYVTYVNLVRPLFAQAEFVSTGMRGEEERCRLALERAQAGERVALVCSGDPGVYGMAGLALELAEEYPGIAVEVIPGVTAATAGAALLGAPLMHDWCCISLSDLMTSWEAIEARLHAAATAGLVICLYNPGSKGRVEHLRRACDVLLKTLPATTVCGIVRSVGRAGESSATLTLQELREAKVDMLTCVFVGNATTRLIGGRMVTPRGYAVETQRQAKVKQAEFLVFGGTTEGRELVEWLDARGNAVVACSATEYGASLVAGGNHVVALQGPLSGEQKRELMAAHDFACIVDATHPYARHIKASIDELARRYDKPVVRIERPDEPVVVAEKDGVLRFASAEQAAHYLATTSGNVLLTTGTRDLATYVAALPDFAERLYVRVLPVESSLAAARELGVPTSHVVAMQGPFSALFNQALVEELDIRYLVTKQSGAAGGFAQKVQAARACGIELVVVERPAQPTGISLIEATNLLEATYGA